MPTWSHVQDGWLPMVDSLSCICWERVLSTIQLQMESWTCPSLGADLDKGDSKCILGLYSNELGIHQNTPMGCANLQGCSLSSYTSDIHIEILYISQSSLCGHSSISMPSHSHSSTASLHANEMLKSISTTFLSWNQAHLQAIGTHFNWTLNQEIVFSAANTENLRKTG